MPPPQRDTTQPSLNLDEILFILFRHKWKILFCTALGIAAAVNVYLDYQPVYESEAKLMLRYVVDRSVVDSLDSQPKTPGTLYGDSLVNSELEILTSWDLAEQVAGAIGAERILPGAQGEISKTLAARAILLGLSASAPRGGNIIYVSYKNADPQLAVQVLDEFLSLYFVRHLELHRSADAFNFVAQQSDQVRARLNQTEEELKQLKAKAGILSLTESTTNINSELTRSREALHAAETESAGQRAAIAETENSIAERKKNLPSVQPETNEAVVKQYRSLLSQLSQLRQAELVRLSRLNPAEVPGLTPDAATIAERIVSQVQSRVSLTPEQRTRVGSSGFAGRDRENALTMARERYRRQNDTGFDFQTRKKDFDTLVREAEQEVLLAHEKSVASRDQSASEQQLLKLSQLQTENLEKQLSDLEKRYPSLLATAAAIPPQSAEFNLSADRANLAGTEARMEALKSRIRELEIQAMKLADIAPQLTELERKREIEDTNYKYFQASLEKARVDEALDPSKIPNISAVQKPSPPTRVTGGLRKKVLARAGGGLALGIALAFLIELIVDRSVKRPLELTTRFRIPMLLWIPYLRHRSRLALRWPGRSHGTSALQQSGNGHMAPWDLDHFIRPFSQALRDRLALYFQVNNMIHKPKLVAVTGCSKGAGTSTLAAGLAAALSETGDGKVLLVDMNVGRPEMHPFFRGTPSCSLSEALVGEPAPAGENLYLAVAVPPGPHQGPIIPKRFYDMVPHLKASDFDYIIFDMPPLNQTSITLATAGYMDKVLLVAEAEKSNRQVVRRAYLELAAVNANVSAVLNKLRFYAPKWLAVEG